MPKFKFGDTVRIITCHPGSVNSYGDVGRVVEVDGSSPFGYGYRVIVPGRMEVGNWQVEHDLEKVEPEFNIGDTVRIIDRNTLSVNDYRDIGIITDRGADTDYYRVLVEGREELGNWQHASQLEKVPSYD